MAIKRKSLSCLTVSRFIIVLFIVFNGVVDEKENDEGRKSFYVTNDIPLSSTFSI